MQDKKIQFRAPPELVDAWADACERLGGQTAVGIALVELFLAQSQTVRAELAGIIPPASGRIELSPVAQEPPAKAGKPFPRVAAKTRPQH